MRRILEKITCKTSHLKYYLHKIAQPKMEDKTQYPGGYFFGTVCNKGVGQRLCQVKHLCDNQANVLIIILENTIGKV